MAACQSGAAAAAAVASASGSNHSQELLNIQRHGRGGATASASCSAGRVAPGPTAICCVLCCVWPAAGGLQQRGRQRACCEPGAVRFPPAIWGTKAQQYQLQAGAGRRHLQRAAGRGRGSLSRLPVATACEGPASLRGAPRRGAAQHSTARGASQHMPAAMQLAPRPVACVWGGEERHSTSPAVRRCRAPTWPLCAACACAAVM